MDNPSQPRQSGDIDARTTDNLPAIIFSAMIVVDTPALALWLANWISASQLITLHLLGVGILLGIAFLLQRRASLPSLVEAGFCILAGPLGTLVLQITRLGQALYPIGQDNLQEVDDNDSGPVSVPDVIHEMHVQGRRSKLLDAEEKSYADIIRHGNLLRHNEIIAAISRNYKPEMYPALSLALGSSSPALKVQAAAVFSKLRRTLGDAANDLLATQLASLTPDTAQDYYERMLNVARSGFVDAGKAQVLMTRASEIAGMGLFATDKLGLSKIESHFAGQLHRDLRKQRPRLKRYSCGGLG